MVFKRKEAKTYGGKKMIEGVYTSGDKCLVIEDVSTTGKSIMETVQHLRESKLQTLDAVVILDREQGGLENLTNNKINLHR
jgi:uridine monophosphate synthetase